ncbi:hypothetical protein J3P85_21720 [Pseudomonas sp. Z1-12]|uniref:hypothetical protein n=1 Tax=Pseudomonas sp. Z1-12 TaxID=2817408 RepID=UPI003DAA4011
MTFVKPFALRPLSQALKLLSITPFLMFSQHTFALIIDGGSLVIDGSAPLDRYTLRNNAQLTANGANTRDILVQSGSQLNLSGSAVNATGISDGVRLFESGATINGSTLVSSRSGLSLGHNIGSGMGAQAIVADSSITGSD